MPEPVAVRTRGVDCPAVPAALDRHAVLAALDTVRDPELDEPITALRFVEDVRVSGSVVQVDLRLPTYFCAPNFAYLMVADAYDAVAALDGVESVAIRLRDHFASEEINAGISAGTGFRGTFPGLADDELAELRRVFRLKAHTAAQERVAAAMLRTGWSVEQLPAATLADAADSPHLAQLIRRRLDLDWMAGPAAPLLLDAVGRPIPVPDLPLQLRLARTTRVSIEGNSGFCRGLLRVRYGLDDGVLAADD